MTGAKATQSNRAQDQTYQRPPTLVYAVDEWPALRLALLGIQYATMAAIYLVLVAIILRHANVSPTSSAGCYGVRS
jgi:hypothetical protein